MKRTCVWKLGACGFALITLCCGLVTLPGCTDGGNVTQLQNVSYDPTRELYKEFDEEFQKHWEKTTGKKVRVTTLHGGSGDQARKVVGGLTPDVVTLALAYDIDAIIEQTKDPATGEGMLKANWQGDFPNNNCPYTSTIVFLVKKGNPKNIKDWDDLIRDDVKIITPNPKTSGGARWNYLAAWGFELKRELGGSFDALKDPTKAKEVAAANLKAEEFVKKMHLNALDMPTGARGATQKFVKNNLGDALLAWENEALLTTIGQNSAEFEIVTPSISIVAEPPVAIVDQVVDKRGTRELAKAYLEYLYSDVGQEIAAKNFYRPYKPEVQEKHQNLFKNLELFKIDDVFGNWQDTQKKHFSQGGIFDRMMGKTDASQ